MKISAHKTRSVFDRYHVVRRADLELAREKATAYMDAKRAALHDGYKTVTIAPSEQEGDS